MALVEYSDSEAEEDQDAPPTASPAVKKRRLDEDARPASDLPPLPATFLDMYSSTVRTSTQDDPSLHAGRKRVTPHVEGNWPTHVYLEWHPQRTEADLLASLIASPRKKVKDISTAAQAGGEVHSLLRNQLGVSLPLHVSLSRPIVLKTEQRDAFLHELKQAIATSGVRHFAVKPANVVWHPNETGMRSFQVLSLQKPANDELRKLLSACNKTAQAFGQPLLYEGNRTGAGPPDPKLPAQADGRFHISIAWALGVSEGDRMCDTPAKGNSGTGGGGNSLGDLQIDFGEVKVRIGQDVTILPLPANRAKKTPLM